MANTRSRESTFSRSSKQQYLKDFDSSRHGPLDKQQFTVDEMKVLGILQTVLGLIAAWQIAYGLLFWSLGFGVLHIVYGTRMYFKYERSTEK